MQLQEAIDAAVAEVGTVLLGKEPQIRLALCCLFARGHLLIEDLPGMGKTTLSHALADVLGLSWKRVQFTSDLLPADILGVSVYDRNDASFSFHPGPIFTQLLLADEINRTTPRTQSALLEAMAEGQVTVEGETRPLPDPFFVVATQNPIHQSGTYPLPESQLDRFLMRLQLGYPHPQAEREMFQRQQSNQTERRPLRQLLSHEQLQQIRTAVGQVHASDNILDYLQRLVAYTRNSPEFEVGLSPRGGLALLDCARTWAVMNSRGHIVPEDLQTVLPTVAAHRLVPSGDYAGDGAALVTLLQRNVDVIRP
ncbi:AAA domain-containing protein [Pseudohalioglobus sediminis]|uniref:AAA domain-containing protein n=1 Tax=Pseudohalioglobus sediminis TaxID=2606449 RepID=A0A5B0X3Q8_9GAMM|nr:AAA family ATPase [Pseudohalioglobus sediminis]KAA1193882.1 AAA domain-containing protein [Pseudohalioglobus sediminis]